MIQSGDTGTCVEPLTFPFPAECCSYTPLEELLLLSLTHFFLHLFLEARDAAVVLEAIFTFLS